MVDLAKYLEPMVRVSCNLCGEDDTTLVHNRERFGLAVNTVLCNRCGLLYLNPRPSEENYRRMYESDYRLAVSGTDEWLEQEFRKQQSYTERWILPFVLRHYSGDIKSLLDVGCSYGGVIWPFKEKFPVALLSGIEPVVKIAEYARLRTGADIRVGSFVPEVFETKFDLIIISRSLNHVLDPFGVLQLARSLLNPKGLLILVLQDGVTTLMLQGLDLFTEITHPYIFTRETAQAMVRKAGFEIVGYEDGLFDPATLSKTEIRSFDFRKRFRKMFVLAEAGNPARENYPSGGSILRRVRLNNEFHMKYKHMMYAGTSVEKIRKKVSGIRKLWPWR